MQYYENKRKEKLFFQPDNTTNILMRKTYLQKMKIQILKIELNYKYEIRILKHDLGRQKLRALETALEKYLGPLDKLSP